MIAAMLLAASVAVEPQPDFGRFLGAPVYFGAMGLDVASTRHALEACRIAQARCYEANPGFHTGQPATALLVASGLTVLDWHLYRKNRAAAWGLRVGVAVGWGLVVRQNMRVAREVGR